MSLYEVVLGHSRNYFLLGFEVVDFWSFAYGFVVFFLGCDKRARLRGPGSSVRLCVCVCGKRRGQTYQGRWAGEPVCVCACGEGGRYNGGRAVAQGSGVSPATGAISGGSTNLSGTTAKANAAGIDEA